MVTLRLLRHSMLTFLLRPRRSLVIRRPPKTLRMPPNGPLFQPLEEKLSKNHTRHSSKPLRPETMKIQLKILSTKRIQLMVKERNQVVPLLVSSSASLLVSVLLVVSATASAPRKDASLRRMDLKMKVVREQTNLSSRRRLRARVPIRDTPRSPLSHLSRSRKRPEPKHHRYDKSILNFNSFT